MSNLVTTAELQADPAAVLARLAAGKRLILTTPEGHPVADLCPRPKPPVKRQAGLSKHLFLGPLPDDLIDPLPEDMWKAFTEPE